MSDNTDFDRSTTCTLTCWAIAALAAILACVIMVQLLGLGVLGAIFLAAILFVILGFLLTSLFCNADAAQSVAQPASQPVAAPPPPAAAPAPEPESAPEPAAAPEPAPEPAAAPEPAPEPEAAPEPEPEPTPAPASAAAPAAASTLLSGEEDLAARKGEWKYGGEASSEPAAAPSGVDYDGDGVVEGTDEGEKPATLDGPRDGKADDLKQIKGVGPKLEKLLNTLGFWHFDQVASWTDQEVAWVDANLEGFKGRVSRDEWVAQAKVLAAGGETEFSKRVEDGDVY